MILIKILVLIAGLVGIFHLFDKLSIKQFQRGQKKFGDSYRQESDVMKVGYFVMAAYLLLFTIFVPRGDGASGLADEQCYGRVCY